MVKQNQRVLCIAGLLTLLPLHRLPAAPYPVIDDLLKQQIIVPRATTTDDYLIELARNADVNFLADATVFPAVATLQPFPETSVALYTKEDGTVSPRVSQPTLLNLIGDLIHQQKFSHLRFDTRTFLFWSEPDVESYVEQARRIAANPGVTIPNKPTGDQQVYQLKLETDALLSSYLQRVHGWNGGVLNPPLDVKFSDLPEDVRSKLTTLTLITLLETQPGREVWFTDKPWPRAFLQISNVTAPEGKREYTQMLAVRSTVGDRQYLVSINMR